MSLSKEKIAHFKKILTQMRGQILGTDQKLSEELLAGNEAALSQHHSEGGLEETDLEISIGIKSQNRELLFQIDKALSRIEEGSYGICEITGEAIPLKRLEAIPYATTTIQGQSILEKGLS